ncbi:MULTISPECIES: hypothetical protein [unclassified Thermoactinomyces]|uniref:hypothetical protein n=1 Tax=unclassified Thermoactinomyces TaxID=2634588 RepID=UPI0018DC096E|nr:MULTISPECIES: hypothetical protein [unclassified Thermoactinomyces]MBH8598634.1 hypothetical protein [Thermoactinomyces sp. CICC 10523]MBH8605109.1 hypothetical protein [Thermoactinomyces sp. CICC 10522]MBH8609074.1 hypothetical protein [Thermoactinomyces sp. CICC 10521]
MDDLIKFLQEEFAKIHEKMDQRFENIDQELAAIKMRLGDVERVVRESAEDILENQVEEVARHNLHEDKIQALEATTFRIDKSVLALKKRVEKLEKGK